MAELDRHNELAGDEERNCLNRATMEVAWLSAVHHNFNGTELYREEFRDICLIYGLMPQDIPATCHGCGKRISIENALSFPKGGLVLAQHDDATKEWGVFGYWLLYLVL